MAIPSVDLSDFLNGDKSQKEAFVQKLGQAYETVGFVAVKNHGVPDELIEKLYRYVQEFFSLPLEEKRKYEIPELAWTKRLYQFRKRTCQRK
jgi:isopenicillin N synthase-like dioxygenase